MRRARLSNEAAALVRAYVATAKAEGLRLVLSPVQAKAYREAGVWDDAVHIEQRPIPTSTRH